MTVSSTTDLSIPKTQRAGISPAADQPSIVAEVPVTQPADLEVGQALVKLLYSGVCASDLTIIKDPNQPIRPCIAGHEGAGVIVAINDPRSVMKVGDRGECARMGLGSCSNRSLFFCSLILQWASSSSRTAATSASSALTDTTCCAPRQSTAAAMLTVLSSSSG